LYGFMETSSKKSSKSSANALRAGCLNFTELSAISVANIGPTIVAALIVPLMYANAGVGYAGTLTAFGFIGSYLLVSIAAPAYLKHQGLVRGRDYALAGAAALMLLFPAVGSVYPVPAWPYSVFPYIFLAYMVVGLLWIRARRKGIAEFAGVNQAAWEVAQAARDAAN
jgi:hypothetical protein